MVWYGRAKVKMSVVMYKRMSSRNGRWLDSSGCWQQGGDHVIYDGGAYKSARTRRRPDLDAALSWLGREQGCTYTPWLPFPVPASQPQQQHVPSRHILRPAVTHIPETPQCPRSPNMATMQCGLAESRASIAPGMHFIQHVVLPSLTSTRDECEAHVKGFQGAVFKKLSTEAEANQFMAAKSSTARTSIVPGAPTTRAPITPDLKTRPSHSEAKDPIDCDTVYCDGACRGNGQPGSVAGIGVWWGHGDPRYVSPIRA